MGADELPKVTLRTGEGLPDGANTYSVIPEKVEFQRIGMPLSSVRTLALGRMAINVDGESGEIVGLQCHVKTGRWKTGTSEPPPEPDAEGILALEYPGGPEDFAYLAVEPRFMWHEESSSLRISLGDGAALFFKVANCLMVGVDRGGRLTDIWMLELDLSPG